MMRIPVRYVLFGLLHLAYLLELSLTESLQVIWLSMRPEVHGISPSLQVSEVKFNFYSLREFKFSNNPKILGPHYWSCYGCLRFLLPTRSPTKRDVAASVYLCTTVPNNHRHSGHVAIQRPSLSPTSRISHHIQHGIVPRAADVHCNAHLSLLDSGQREYNSYCNFAIRPTDWPHERDVSVRTTGPICALERAICNICSFIAGTDWYFGHSSKSII